MQAVKESQFIALGMHGVARRYCRRVTVYTVHAYVPYLWRSQDGRSALHYACGAGEFGWRLPASQSNATQTVEALLHAGANPNAQDKVGGMVHTGWRHMFPPHACGVLVCVIVLWVCVFARACDDGACVCV